MTEHENRTVDPDEFGPSQGPVLETLLEAGDELTTGEIVDRVERMDQASVRKALRCLQRDGIVEGREYNAVGWFKYRVVGSRGGRDV